MSQSPFKFLDAYDQEDVDIFFGRKEATVQLYNQLHDNDLLLVYGTSGTGKTSLIQCGLSNLFADTDWLPVFIRKGENIIQSLENALLKKARRKDKLEGRSIWEQIHSVYLDYYTPIYLIFDQFEEIFILGEEEESSNFFWLLSELLEQELQCKIILILREEYLAYLDHYEKIVPSLFANRFRVEHMRQEQIEEVVRETAASERFRIQLESDELIRQVVENTRNEKGFIDLANLQVYLDRLYRNDLQRMQKNGKERPVSFDQELLRSTGKLADVLSLFLDEQLHQIDQDLRRKFKVPENSDIPLSILSELITNQATKHIREVDIIKADLKHNKNIDPQHIAFCVQRLIETRILRELI